MNLKKKNFAYFFDIYLRLIHKFNTPNFRHTKFFCYCELILPIITYVSLFFKNFFDKIFNGYNKYI